MARAEAPFQRARSDQHLACVVGLGPVQDLVALAQACRKKWVSLKQGLDLGFGFGLCEPQSALRNRPGLGAQGAAHGDDVLVRLQPCNVRWELGGADIATAGLVGEDHGKEHGVRVGWRSSCGLASQAVLICY